MHLNRCAEYCRRLSHANGFAGSVLTLILLNAFLMGLETSPALVESFPRLFEQLNRVIQTLFVAEIAVRMVGFLPRPHTFFRDGWNTFDFIVVALSFLPVSGPYATVARLVRVLRAARLISFSPDLRLIIGTMLRSLPSMGHVMMLLGLLLYVYGIVGYQLFHSHDPSNWGTLGKAILSLFKVLTLENWVELQDKAMERFEWAWLYFMSFVVVAVFVVINLFIAVVINNLDVVKKEQTFGDMNLKGNLETDIGVVQEKLKQIEVQIKNLNVTQKG